MRITRLQTNFSSGELDPLLRARIDLPQYQNGLSRAKNVIIQPQGGVRRRDGLRFIHDFSNFAGSASVKLVAFEYSTSDSYLLVFVPGRIYVFKQGVLQTNINGSGNDYITATAFTASVISEMAYTQAADTLILCHEDIAPKRLIRNADDDWTLEDIPFKTIPKFAFDFHTHEPAFSITPSAIEGKITLTASSVTTDTGTAQGGSISTIQLQAVTPYTTDDQPNGMYVEITSGTGAGQSRHIHDYDSATLTATVDPDWSTAPDNTSVYNVVAFTSEAVGQYVQVKSGFGRARMVEYVSATEMEAVTEVPFFDSNAVVAGDWEGEYSYEDSWSVTRGWPRSATFYQGRLYMGGSKSRRNTIWGSRVVDYFNFDYGTGLDDEAIEATLNTDQYNAITAIDSLGDLRIFTTGGEFVVTPPNTGVVTPSAFVVRPQTKLGIKPGTPIENLDGASVFIQRGGKSITSFQYTDSTNSYQTQSLSILSSHLIRNPIDLAIRRGQASDETDTMYVCNENQGMTVYSILSGQGIIAASEFITGQRDNDSFVAVAVDISTVYVLVKRTLWIGGSPSISMFLEQFDQSMLLDSCVDDANMGTTASVTFDHQPDATVKIIVDGIMQEDQTVPSSSPYTVTFNPSAQTSYQVGLDFDVEVSTMPNAPNLNTGPKQGVRKRIVQVDVFVQDTQSLSVNGNNVLFVDFGTNVFDTEIPPYTGMKTVFGMLGYTSDGKITLSQNYPLAMNVLGAEYVISLGD